MRTLQKIKPKVKSVLFRDKIDTTVATRSTSGKLTINTEAKDSLNSYDKVSRLAKGQLDSTSKRSYDSRTMESVLVKRNSGKKVVSSTLPKLNDKNVKLAGSRHKKSGIVYDTRGFPIFDDIALYDTRISPKLSRIKNSRMHMKAATADLKQKILQGKVSNNNFTKEQITQIMSEKERIKGLTWHHHQDSGRMQLLPNKIHIGGMKLWFRE